MKDQANIGLSEDMRLKLKDMLENGVFAEMRDGYRLAASIAIKRLLDVAERDLPNRQNMYDVGGIDQDFIFRNSIAELFPSARGQEYRYLEKLADAGIEIIYENFQNNRSLNFEDLMADEC